MPRDSIAARFFVAITNEIHEKRPRLRRRSGHSLLSELMEQIGTDACQRTPAETVLTGPSCAGYVDDPRSVKAQRFLLRHLEAVTRSARPPSDPGIPLGREACRTETTARATSAAVQSE